MRLGQPARPRDIDSEIGRVSVDHRWQNLWEQLPRPLCWSVGDRLSQPLDAHIHIELGLPFASQLREGSE